MARGLRADIWSPYFATRYVNLLPASIQGSKYFLSAKNVNSNTELASPNLS